jgi:hypothetical protein
MHKSILTATLCALLALPAAVQAQGLVRGAEEGANSGGQAAGPVGAVVGGVIGGVGGTIGGILGVDTRPRFQEYVIREPRPVYQYSGEVSVGAVLPEQGVTYYEVPAEYNAPGYQYTNINGRYVLVEPRTRRVVDVIR